MRYRLIAGTINRYEGEEGWRNVHLDKSGRGIWDPELEIHVQPEFVMDIAELAPFRDEMFDEVRMWHTLEHLTFKQATLAAAAIFRVLKPGGQLDVEVPDMDRLCDAWLTRAHSFAELCQWFYSEDVDMQDPEFNAHRYGYNEETLIALLTDAGFDVPGPRVETGLALRLIAVKA